MRKLTVLLVTAGLLLGFAGSSQAGTLIPAQSTLGLVIGGLPSVTTIALPGTEPLVNLASLDPDPGHVIIIGSGTAKTVWSTVNFGPGTALFTGVPLISNLKVTVSNEAGILFDNAFADPTNTNQIGGGDPFGPTFGGNMRLAGQVVISALGGAIKLPVPLSGVGGPMGGTTMATLLGNNITVTNGPFIAGEWVITGISTNVITIPNRNNVQGVAFTLMPTPAETVMNPSTNGGFTSISGGDPEELQTVTIQGTANLQSASQPGTVTVIAPMRIDTTGIAGKIPGSATAVFTFVPEPGTMLLLVSGAVGLAVIGRRRMRK